MTDSVIKSNKKYYPRALLEECKYIQEKIKTENYINEDLENSESDSDSNDETESDIDNEEQFAKNIFNTNKSLIVCVNHTLLGFILRQTILLRLFLLLDIFFDIFLVFF